jgi:uncharacterized protein (TIGR03083 family)
MSEPSWTRVPDDVSYRAIRENVTALLADREDVADTPVPACPDWSVRDLVSHLLDTSVMVLGRATGSPPPVPPADAPLADLLDAWRRLGEAVDAGLRARGGGGGGIMVMDAFTHEVDLYYAVGAPVPTEHVAYHRVLDVVARAFGESVRTHGLPALHVACEGLEWVTGTGDPVATLTAARHDLHRSLAGRRTHGQIAALDWSGDPRTWLPAFAWGPFTPPGTPADVVRPGS